MDETCRDGRCSTTHDASTMPPHIDSKRRKKLRQRKNTALGHAEDDHVEWTMEQHL